jgi:dienelactone hydrolase
VVYDGAGHGFMRQGEKAFTGARDADLKAYDAAWARWKDLLKKI